MLQNIKGQGRGCATLELLLDDRPDGLMSSLGILDLLLPELGGPLLSRRSSDHDDDDDCYC